MTKLMSALCRGLDAGALERMPNNRSNTTLAQKATDGSFAAQKHATTGAARPSVAQVRGDRRPDIDRQRKGGSMAAFALDADLSCVPVNIFKLEKSHLT
jgi:hypothetical protein